MIMTGGNQQPSQRPPNTIPGLVRLDRDDNVAVATRRLPRGQSVSLADLTVTPRSDIPPGHKVAIASIASGSPVAKYGQPIGLATADIQPGDHVHSHNLTDHHVVSDDLSSLAPPEPPAKLSRTFEGFHRSDGRVGTRNYVALISTVNWTRHGVPQSGGAI